MKRLFKITIKLVIAFAFLVLSNAGWGQTTIFTETIGSVAATTAIATHETANGFDNDAFTMSGSGDIRATTPSTGYTGASGLANVFLTNTAGRNFQIAGVNTVGYSSIGLSFGVLSSVANNICTVEYSTDGVSYTALTVNSTISANTWTLKTATGAIPASSTLYLRWTQPATTAQFRIDDITLTGIGSSPALSSSTSSLSGFTYVQGSGPSANQTFTINGSNLTGSGNITVTGTTNYEVSTDGTTFAASITYPFASGIITGQPKTVYVRLKAGLTSAASPYNGETIAISGGGATTINVTCNGTVTSTVVSKKILWDGLHAETESSADWSVDEDAYTVGWNTSGACAAGVEGKPQQTPTPAQSGITAGTVETYWNGGNSAWAVALVKAGYTIESLTPCAASITFGNAGNPQDLSNYSVFIVNEPNTVFTAAEKTAILNFVNAGGGLYMGADHGLPTPADRNGDGFNSTDVWTGLLSATDPFGIQFNNDEITGVTSNFVSATDPIISGLAGTVASTSFNQGASLSTNTCGNASVIGVVYTSGVALPSTNAVRVARASYGAGRVVGVGDSSPTDDGTGDPGDVLFNNWGDYNNSTLILNATYWLAEGSPQFYVTPSCITGFNYAEGSGPSTSSTFSLSGYRLTGSGNITVAGNTWFEVSTDGTTFAASVTYPYSSGIITGQPKTVYVRLKAGLTQAASPYNNKLIAITGGSADPVNVQCSGYVTAPVLPSITLGTNPSICSGTTTASLPYSATTNSPNQYSITWDATAIAAGFTNVALTALPVSPITLTVPGGAIAGVYNGTIVVKNTTSGLSSTGTTFTVTINTSVTPSVSIATSATTICAGTSVTFTPTPTNGGAAPTYQWKLNGSNIATGSTYTSTTLANADIVSCVMTSNYTCLITTTATSNNITMTVNPSPTISGTLSACNGATTTLTGNPAGGTWTSGTTAVATVSGGVVTGVSGGTSVITYTSSGCSSTATVTITSPSISGTTSVSAGSTTTLTGTPTGGSWSSGTTSVATIDAVTGVVTGVAVGTSVITYTVSGCSTTTNVTVTAASSNCLQQLNFTAIPAGWAQTSITYATNEANFGATTGELTTLAIANPASLTFDLRRSTNATAKILYVEVCTTSQTGTFTTIATYDHTNTTSGGTITCNVDLSAYTCFSTVYIKLRKASTTTSPWYVKNFSVTCGSCVCTTPTITAQPSASTQTICQNGTATALSVTASPATGYQWYSNATASNSGGTIVSGATSSSYTPATTTAGDLYYYCVVTNGSSTCTTTSTISGKITVTANPAISGTLSACTGSTITLSGSLAGGTWSSATTTVATINSSSGVVTGVAAGTSVITYTESGCSSTATVTITTSIPVISGTLSVCTGSTTTLTGTPTGGTWSSGTPAYATVNSSTGVVTGVAAGTSVITYTTSCGSSNATVTINTSPIISGTLTLCGGSTTTLTASPTGGTWSSATTTVATVNSSTGVVTGVAAGTSVITYTAPSGCTTTATVTVTAPSISGSLSVTIGSTTTLTGSPAGGSWSSGTPANATVNSSTGVVTGVAVGTSVITYTVSGCSTTTTVTSSSGPCLSEGFAGGITAPAGWTFTGITSTYTGAVNFGIASPSIKFDGTADVIQTPLFTNASQLSFYCMEIASFGSSILVEGWDGSSWLTIDNITSLPTVDGTYITYNASTTPALSSGFTKFRLTFTKTGGNVAIDDFEVVCNPTFKEMGVTGNGNAIVDGDATPTASDWTDFGSTITAGGTVDRIFTIQNFGTSTLNLTGTPIVTTTGDFTVIAQPSASAISTGGTLTFTIRFDPIIDGLRTGTINIANDDPNENPYNFSIQGTGTPTASVWLIDEKFDAVSSVATITNTNTTGFTASGTGTISAATSASNFNRSTNALTFLGASGATVVITTPTFANADMLSFWYKHTDALASANPLLIEQYSPTKAGWTTLATISASAATSKARIYFYPLTSNITQIRFTYTRTSNAYQGYFDDVRIRAAGSCATDIKILQTLIQSCGGSEGINESVIFKTGANPVNVNNLSVSFPNVGAGGTEYSTEASQTFVSNPAYVASLNALVQATYPACSPVLEPPSGIIPANSLAVIFTGSTPNVIYDFKAACLSGLTYYAVFCNNTNTVGRYGNNPAVGELDYTTVIDKTTGCYDSQFYDSSIPNTAGALAKYDEITRVRTYENWGCEILLPIELESFTAYCDNNSILVSWTTSSEINNDFFTIEKSEDLEDWYSIANINGNGNSNSILNYSFNDFTPTTGTIYYRLKQTDFNGNYKYFGPISLSCESYDNSMFTIYPNPVDAELKTDFYLTSETSVTCEITNAYGQVLLSENRNLPKGLNHLSLDLSKKASGIYLLKIFDKGGRFIRTKTFIKQ